MQVGDLKSSECLSEETQALLRALSLEQNNAQDHGVLEGRENVSHHGPTNQPTTMSITTSAHGEQRSAPLQTGTDH